MPMTLPLLLKILMGAATGIWTADAGVSLLKHFGILESPEEKLMDRQVRMQKTGMLANAMLTRGNAAERAAERENDYLMESLHADDQKPQQDMQRVLLQAMLQQGTAAQARPFSSPTQYLVQSGLL